MAEMLLTRAIGLTAAIWAMQPVFAQIAAIAHDLQTLNVATLQMLN
jgi:hypothetical protein